MYTFDTTLRVRYAETDQMGVVYHGNFFQYFEVARAEAIRTLGFTYADMEKSGVIMPVIEVQCRYLRPALYDDLLTVRVILKEMPHNHKIEFLQEVYNEKQELLASGYVILYFMEAGAMRRSSMPEPLRLRLQEYFN
ncbi:MAG: acyl-CoA thioesterase [Chitinophagaceae bacterium]|nr:MAG: acyl-CoA thioesterase [Chitinophagaceae bacterium]